MYTCLPQLDLLQQLIRPDFKADEGVWPESLRNWNVRGIAALGDQDAADPRNVVACVEGVPVAAEIGLKPAGKVARRVGRRHSDITEIAGAISRGNVHAAAERDGKVRVVAADAFALVEYLRRRHGRPRMLVTKRDVVVNEIADCLDPRPTRCCPLEQRPRNIGK